MYKSFPGSIKGILPNTINSVSDTDRKHYHYLISNQGWRPQPLRYEKGVDNDFSTITPLEINNNFMTEKIAKENLSLRAEKNRPLRKDIGLHQIEIPRYGGSSGLKAPEMRNPTAFWNKILKTPEELCFKTFLSYANKSSHIKSNKYLSEYLNGGLKKRVSRNPNPSYEHLTQDFKTRDPFHTDHFNGTTYIPLILNKESTSSTKFAELGENRYIRGLLDYNNPGVNVGRKQTISEITNIKNDESHMTLIPEKFIVSEQKLPDRANYNEVKHLSPYYNDIIADLQVKRGGLLDNMLPSNKSTIKIGANAMNREIDLKNDLGKHYLPERISQNINNNTKINMKFHNREISIQA